MLNRLPNNSRFNSLPFFFFSYLIVRVQHSTVSHKANTVLFSVHPRPTQPPTLSGTGNEYQPKCGDALWLGSKGRYGSFHSWINVWVAGKTVYPSLRPSIPERFNWVMIKRYTNVRILYFYFTIWGQHTVVWETVSVTSGHSRQCEIICIRWRLCSLTGWSASAVVDLLA